MSGFVSQKQFLDFLQTVDYVKFGQVDLPFTRVIEECETAVEQNPSYWYSIVATDDNFEVWDEAGNQLKEKMQQVTEGYLPENTRAWKTTTSRPQIQFDWEQLIHDCLPLNHAVSTPTMQPPGNVMPWHIDRFVFLTRQYPDATGVIRFLIFLKDWENGHVLQVGKSLVPHGQAGDTITWHPERFHISANIGNTNKWTCNITGILTEQIPFKI